MSRFQSSCLPIFLKDLFLPLVIRMIKRSRCGGVTHHESMRGVPLGAGPSFRNRSAAPLIQKRFPVVRRGPSSKRCPRWPPQLLHPTSRPNNAARGFANGPPPSTTTASADAAQKLGQPVPESNLHSLKKSGARHPAQTKVPARSSPSSSEEKAGSVPPRSTELARDDLGDSCGSEEDGSGTAGSPGDEDRGGTSRLLRILFKTNPSPNDEAGAKPREVINEIYSAIIARESILSTRS